MVVSFRINRKGRRYTPKPKLESTTDDDGDEVDDQDQERQLPQINQPPPATSKKSVDLTKDDGDGAENSDAEVSFIISLFPNGYLIETPSERIVNAVEDDLKVLHPYDIHSESLFTAIECGHLPVNFLDDIHCKYVNGTVLCEVRDYRKKFSKDAACPSITKVSLKMTLENVVNDIHLIADTSWEYGDILEAEARIISALQPKLCLDRTPNLERLCKDPTCIKLNVDIWGLRRKRLRQMSGATTAPQSSDLRVGESSSKLGQPDFMNLASHNVGQSSTRSINHLPETSTLWAGDSKQVMGQSDYLNTTNQNVGQSGMVATNPTNHASENSNLRTGESSSKMDQPDSMNLANQNVGQSSTSPINYSPENSKLRAGDSKEVMGQSDHVNMTNHNDESSMVATKPTNHASESSNLRAGGSSSKTGQPDFMNLANQNPNVGHSSTRPINYSPETSSRSAGNSRQVMGRFDYVNMTKQNVGQSSMIATRPTNHAPESLNLRARETSSKMGQPDFMNLANPNVGQSNMIATRPTSCTPEDSRSIMCQPDFVNLANQNVDESNKVATRHLNRAPDISYTRSRDLRSITSQPDFVNLATQNVGQSGMTFTGPGNHVLENSNILGGASRSIAGQSGFVNMTNQNVGQSNMIATRSINHATETSNLRAGDSRLITGQHDFVNVATQNVSQRDMIATRPTNHAPEGDSRSLMGEHGFVNLANQNVGQSKMITTRPIHHEPENSNLRAGDSRMIMGPPGCVNPPNHNFGRQNNLITTRSTNHAPKSLIRASSSVFNESRYQNGVEIQPRHMPNRAPQISCTFSGHDMMKPHMSNGVSMVMPPFHGKRGYQDEKMSHMVNSNKRCRSNPDGKQLQQQSNRDDIQQLFDEIFNRDKGQQGSRNNVKQDSLKTITMNRYEPNQVQQRLPQQQLIRSTTLQQQFTRSIAPQHSMSQILENDIKKEESFGEPVGRRLGAAVGSAGKGKSMVTSVAGIQSSHLSGKESMQQPPTGANWRSNLLPKISRGGPSSSSSSVGNMIGPFTPSSPIDGSMHDRFSTIGMLTVRFKLNSRKNKIDDDYKPSINFPTQQLKHALDDNSDTNKDENCIMPLSTSLMGGSINICKTRILNFVKNEHLLPTEDGILLMPKLKTRLILSERASDGTVAMHLGELDDCDHYLEEDHLLPTLANTHTADLLADQFCSLMLREGYHLEDDHVEPKPMSTVEISANGSCEGDFTIFDIQEGADLGDEVVKSLTNIPTTHPQGKGGLLAEFVMASSSRSLESEPQSTLFQEQQKELQRSSAMISQMSNPMPGQNILNMNQQQHLVSNRALQLQQQFPIQRMEPGNVNNKRIIGRVGSPIMRQNSMMNINQPGLNIRSGISQQALHSGPLTPIHAAFMATEPRMAHSATGGLVGHRSNLGGNNRQMHLGSGSGVSMLGSGINRANHINTMPRTNVIAQPNLILGRNQNQNQNRYVNQQQLWVDPSCNIQTVDLPAEHKVSSPWSFD